MQYSQNEYINIAHWITSLLQQEYLDEKGILIQGFAEGEYIKNQIIDDFGDVAPFISLYGGEEMCRHHIEYISNNRDSLGFSRAFAYTDLILGLIWYSRIGKYADQALHLAEELASEVNSRWYRGASLYSQSYKGITLPITNGIDSTFIEVWTELYRSTKRREYLDKARETSSYFNKLRKTRNDNLIPEHYVPCFIQPFAAKVFPRKFGSVHIMKDNSNYCFALLDLFRISADKDIKEQFDYTFATLSVFAIHDHLRNKNPNNVELSTLLPSFAFIDLSCDAYKLFADEVYLQRAVSLASKWIERQSKETGLMPMKANENWSYFDSETDMAIALHKVYECTGEQRFKEASIKIAEGIIRYHKVSSGFVLCTNIYNGAVINSCIKTKFVALFIKLLHLLQDEQKIYDNEILFMLMKDR